MKWYENNNLILHVTKNMYNVFLITSTISDIFFLHMHGSGKTQHIYIFIFIYTANFFIRSLRWENGCENGRYVRGFPYYVVLWSRVRILYVDVYNVLVWQKKKRFLIFMLESQVSCWWQRITEYMREYKRILHKFKHIPSVWQLWMFIIASMLADTSSYSQYKICRWNWMETNLFTNFFLYLKFAYNSVIASFHLIC